MSCVVHRSVQFKRSSDRNDRLMGRTGKTLTPAANARTKNRGEYLGAAIPLTLLPDYFETCRSRDHMVGDECIAFRDPERVPEILKERGDD